MDDFRNLRERQTIYLVSVPGEAQWVKNTLDTVASNDLHSQVARMSLNDVPPSSEGTNVASASARAGKYPLPAEPHFGIIAKIYGDLTEAYKVADVFNFVGILGDAVVSNPFEDLSGDPLIQPNPSAPALHVLFSTPSTGPMLKIPSDLQPIRSALVQYIMSALGGDQDAAEWTLLSLLSKIHTRHASGISLGSLSLNLMLSDSSQPSLASAIAELVPRMSKMELSISHLNDSNTRMSPRVRDEDLESGALQLAAGTVVLVDMRRISEGKLEDRGVRNLQQLTNTIATQKLSYEFPYSSFDLDTDLRFIILSEGKSFIPTDCLMPLRAEGSRTDLNVTDGQLSEFRAFIRAMREAPFTITQGVSEFIQNDFVNQRQKTLSGDAMTQEDLLLCMTAARLMALSYGKETLDENIWTQTKALDDRRKARLGTLGSAKGGAL